MWMSEGCRQKAAHVQGNPPQTSGGPPLSHSTRRYDEVLALAEEARHDGSFALTVHGTVDDETVEEFERSLDSALEGEPDRLVLDLSDCRLDSAGLAALVRVQRRFRDRPSCTSL